MLNFIATCVRNKLQLLRKSYQPIKLLFTLHRLPWRPVWRTLRLNLNSFLLFLKAQNKIFWGGADQLLDRVGFFLFLTNQLLAFSLSSSPSSSWWIHDCKEPGWFFFATEQLRRWFLEFRCTQTMLFSKRQSRQKRLVDFCGILGQDWTFCDAVDRGTYLRRAPQSGGGEELQPGGRHEDSGILDVNVVAGFEEAMDFIGTRETGSCRNLKCGKMSWTFFLWWWSRMSRLDGRLRPPRTDKMWDINNIDGTVTLWKLGGSKTSDLDSNQNLDGTASCRTELWELVFFPPLLSDLVLVLIIEPYMN